LFVLTTDLLQSIINRAKEIGLLKLPINVGYTFDFPITQHADGTLLIMEVWPLQLFTLKALLNTFADSTELRVNYSKSWLYPINLSHERLNHLSATFNCKAGSLPFTYLGLPLSLNKPIVQDCLPLVHIVERRQQYINIYESGRQALNGKFNGIFIGYILYVFHQSANNNIKTIWQMPKTLLMEGVTSMPKNHHWQLRKWSQNQN
jgi:hypothetical protein